MSRFDIQLRECNRDGHGDWVPVGNIFLLQGSLVKLYTVNRGKDYVLTIERDLEPSENLVLQFAPSLTGRFRPPYILVRKNPYSQVEVGNQDYYWKQLQTFRDSVTFPGPLLDCNLCFQEVSQASTGPFMLVLNISSASRQLHSHHLLFVVRQDDCLHTSSSPI